MKRKKNEMKMLFIREDLTCQEMQVLGVARKRYNNKQATELQRKRKKRNEFDRNTYDNKYK